MDYQQEDEIQSRSVEPAKTKSRKDTALVTGGTDGIGKAVAVGLAKAGHRVLIVGRDNDKGRRAEKELRDASGNRDVTFLRTDVSLVRDTIKLADEVARIAPDLHLVVHSAGIVRGRRELTVEGIESNFAVNYVARFALTTRLLPLLVANGGPAATSRVVILGGAAQSGKIHFEDPSLAVGFGTLRAVGQFCQANDVFTVELARRLGNAPHVTINCLKIGVVKTSIRREFPRWMKVLVPILMDPFLAKQPAEVAQHALELLLDPGYEGVTGRHYSLIRRFKLVQPREATLDPDTGRDLWELSERSLAKALTS